MRCKEIYALFSLCLIGKAVSFDNEVETRVFDGQDLQPELHRHLVLLRIKDSRYRRCATCSGSVIGSNWVISAAHCFSEYTTKVRIWHTVEKGQLIKVGVSEEILRHPEFKVRGQQTYIKITDRVYDMALVKTIEPFGDEVKPIALAATMPELSDKAIIAGYGSTELNDEAPREGIVKITYCLSGQTNLICSYGVTRAGSGDSGGPLVINNRLYGVISTVQVVDTYQPRKCETASASVAHNLKWILHVMKNY